MKDLLPSVKNWSTPELEGILEFLRGSNDPYAATAVKMVQAELRMRYGRFLKSTKKRPNGG